MRTTTSPGKIERIQRDARALNIIIYAQSTADDMKLDNTICYLSSAAQELASVVKESLQTDSSDILLTSLATSKAGNC